MSDTVFILGAGFSYSAGIPLLGGFVDRMWEYAVRQRTSNDKLTSDDIETFKQAMLIRDELDGYHGRAMFDDRNIEDLLSILSFNALASGQRNKAKLAAMTKAIARTIDLSCSVRHPGVDASNVRVVTEGPDVYRNFWISLFGAMKLGKALPTVITFNYDLVLERSLLQTLIGTHFGLSKPLPFQRLGVAYNNPLHLGVGYSIRYLSYHAHSRRRMDLVEGSAISEVPLEDVQGDCQIELLKLHGSLNFPRRRAKTWGAKTKAFNLTHQLDDPFILPPVFNKLSSDAPTSMWKTALERLSHAKNVVVVGYSLPQTDIYMQYFLKAALGPNRNLNRITVFDPVLFSDSPANSSMRARYEACFSPQLRSRIDFSPAVGARLGGDVLKGSTEHFVSTLGLSPESLLF